MLDSLLVTQLPIATNQTAKSTPMSRALWAILIVATLWICYFTHLGSIAFAGPDEPRYAWIARDMAESGDWVTPKLYGKPWFEKPVLYYWEAAISFKIFGVSEAAARLPSAISALFATLAIAWLVLQFYGAFAARWLLVLLPTSVGMLGFAHSAATDMPFSGMLTISLVAAAVVVGLTRGDHSPVIRSTPWLALFLFGSFLGLSVLAKGPAALILVAGTFLFWALLTRKWRDTLRLLHPFGIAVFLAVAMPWYVLCAQRNPDFFRIFIIEHNFKRYLTPEFQHLQPFYFYVPILLLAVFPWTATFLWAATTGLSRVFKSKQIAASTAFLVSWASFPILFFSTSKAKLPGYILPAIPAVAALIVHTTLSADRSKRSAAWAHWVVASLALAIFVAISNFSSHAISLQGGKPILVIFATANAFLALGFAKIPWRTACIALSSLPIPLGLLFSGSQFESLNQRFFTAKEIAHVIGDAQLPLEKMFVINDGNRAWRYSLNFYLHREIPAWPTTVPQAGYVLTSRSNCSALQTASLNCEEINWGAEGLGWRLLRLSPKS